MRVDDYAAIEGLALIHDWVTELREDSILALCRPAGARRPGFRLRNRIDRYGAGVASSGYTLADHTQIEIPAFLRELGERLMLSEPIAMPDAITVGWYLPGQSIGPHIDSPRSGPVIAILGLAGKATMRFTREAAPDVVDIEFPRRTLMIMQGPARWDWQHEILPVAETRLSIVFRRALP